jgi:hypothetical protein
MSIVETPFWDDFPYTNNDDLGPLAPGENPVRVRSWMPLQAFIVDGVYELTRIEVYGKMCNYVPTELNGFPQFPQGELRASLYNWTPADGGDFTVPGDRHMANYHFDITAEMANAGHISLTTSSGTGPIVSTDPPTGYSIRFSLNSDVYDFCIYRADVDTLTGVGYVLETETWSEMPVGQGQDVAMKLYGLKHDTTDDDFDDDGIPDDLDDDIDNDGILNEDDDDDYSVDVLGGNGYVEPTPLLTAFLFALGVILILMGMGMLPLSGFGWLMILIVFTIAFALWYFWLFWSWIVIWT